MPLAVKPIHIDDDIEPVALSKKERLSIFIQDEVERALHDVERRKKHADAELDHRAHKARKRIVSTGRRLEKSLRHPPLPIAPLTIGFALIGAALLFNRRI